MPKSGTIGKKAQFNVKIDAELETNAGPQLVGANNDVKGDIFIINLDQCIHFTPEPEQGLVIERTEDETEFSVDTAECGPIPMDLRFCGGGSDSCRGGTSEGGLNLRPWRYSSVSEESKSVVVERGSMPGFYGISVEARPQSGSWRKVAEIDTIVEPEEEYYFEMDKYDFTVIGAGSKDSSTLTNSMLLENVEVTSNICDAAAAASDSGLFSGAGGGIMAMGAGALGGAAAGWAAY